MKTKFLAALFIFVSLIGANANSLHGGAANPYNYTGVVATRNFTPQTLQAGPTQMMVETFHDYRGSGIGAGIQFRLPNWGLGGSFAETGPGGPITETAAVWCNGAKVATLTVGGLTTWAVANNDEAITDASATATLDLTTCPTFPRFTLRVWADAPSGIYVSNNSNKPLDITNGDIAAFGATVADATQGGTITSSGSGAAYYPTAIVGDTNLPSVYLLGDSITIGIHDTSDYSGDIGWGRLMSASGITGPPFPNGGLAYINGGVSSDTLTAYLASHTHQKFLADTYTTDFVNMMGTNDLNVLNKTGAQVIALQQTLYALYPTKNVWQGTITPIASSSNSYIDLAGQTTSSHNADRITVNTFDRTLANVIDVCQFVESSLNSGFWTINGTSGWPNSGDAIHPNGVIYRNVLWTHVAGPWFFSRGSFKPVVSNLWDPLLGLGSVANGGKLASWYDVADNTSIGLQGVGLGLKSISSKPDGNGVSQSTQANQPSFTPNGFDYGINQATFNNVGMLQNASSNPFLPVGSANGWFFAIVNQTADGAALTTSGKMAGYGNGARSLRRSSVSSNNRLTGTADGISNTDTAMDFSGKHVVAINFESGNIFTYLDGVATTPASTASAFNTLSAANLTIGNTSVATNLGFVGDIENFIVATDLSGDVTTGEVSKMWGWAEWAAHIQSNAIFQSSNSPYKTAPPTLH